MFAQLQDSIRQVGHAIRMRRDLAAIERKHVRANAAKPDDLESLHWLGGLRFLKGDLSGADRFMERAWRIDAVHARYPLAIHDWIDEEYGSAPAKAYIARYIANRDANIFAQIDAYVVHLRTTKYVDYPLNIHIETLALCNAACTFCQYPELLRKGDKMPGDLIDKILGEIAGLPRDVPVNIILSGVSEPLLDKRIFRHIEFINKNAPQARVGINTNGAPLTPKVLDKLIGLDIHWLSVSMNDHRKAEYEATMKISYERTLEVIGMLDRRKAAGEIPLAVGLTRAGDGSIDDLRYIEWIKANYPNCSTYFTPQFVWVGDAGRVPVAPNAGCAHWFDVTIRSTGQVAFCCIDGHIASPHGDLRTQSLLEVYNNPRLRELRLKPVRRPDIAECRACTSG